jgi:hypothetical protein
LGAYKCAIILETFSIWFFSNFDEDPFRMSQEGYTEKGMVRLSKERHTKI